MYVKSTRKANELVFAICWLKNRSTRELTILSTPTANVDFTLTISRTQSSFCLKDVTQNRANWLMRIQCAVKLSRHCSISHLISDWRQKLAGASWKLPISHSKARIPSQRIPSECKIIQNYHIFFRSKFCFDQKVMETAFNWNPLVHESRNKIVVVCFCWKSVQKLCVEQTEERKKKKIFCGFLIFCKK